MAKSTLQGPSRHRSTVVHDHVRRNQYVTTLFLVLLPCTALASAPPGPATSLGLLGALGACLLLYLAIIGRPFAPRSKALEPLGWALLAGTLLTALFAFTRTDYGWIWMFLPGAAAGNIAAIRHPINPLFWSSAVATAASAGVFLLSWEARGPAEAGQAAAGVFVFVAIIGYWEASGPLLAQRTAAAEEAAMRLAASRERLRIAEELHDVLGRALETVAFKSELADRLLDTDTRRVRRELEQIQQVAREAVNDVRSLVRTSRSTDLVRELAAGRALLESAGVALEVRGDAGRVPEELRDVFGRVLREAVTNILRHTRTRRCVVEICAGAERVGLSVRNDGVGEEYTAHDRGTGLEGVRARLAEAGGELRAGREGTEFVLRAAAPLPES